MCCDKNKRLKHPCASCGKEEPSATATYWVEVLGNDQKDLKLHCSLCGLKEIKKWKETDLCLECKGTGEVDNDDPDGHTLECWTCGGTGVKNAKNK